MNRNAARRPSRTFGARRILAVLAVAAVLVGCGTDDTADTGADTADTGADDIDDASGDNAAPAELFGFLVAVDAEAGTIGFDEATWIDDEELDGGFAIDNDDTTAHTYSVASEADLTVMTSTGDPSTETSVDLAGLADWLGTLADPGSEAAVDIVAQGDQVTSLTFVYRP